MSKRVHPCFRTLMTGFLSKDLVSGPQWWVFFLWILFQIRLEVWIEYWESRFRSFIEDFGHLGSGLWSCQLDNNCHRDQNSQIKKFLNLPGPFPFQQSTWQGTDNDWNNFSGIAQIDRQTDIVALIYYNLEFHKISLLCIWHLQRLKDGLGDEWKAQKESHFMDNSNV